MTNRVADQVTDPWDYFIAAPGKGTGVPIAARVDPDVKAIIARVVQSGRTKFDTENDFVRSAVHYFIYDKFGRKFHEGRIDEGVAVYVQRVAKAQHAARAYDLKRFQDLNRDAVLKLWAMGAEGEAVSYFTEMLREAQLVHPMFAARVREWAKSDPALGEIRVAARRARAANAERDTDEHDDEGDRRRPTKGSGSGSGSGKGKGRR